MVSRIKVLNEENFKASVKSPRKYESRLEYYINLDLYSTGKSGGSE